MKIAIYSDLHLDFSGFTPPEALGADVVILAGDIRTPGHDVMRWARRPTVFGDAPVIHVAGNHEFYGTTYDSERRLMREEAVRTGGHFLDCSSVVIAGVRFLGCTLWTDFRLRMPDLSRRLREYPEEAQELAEDRMNDYQLINFMTGQLGERQIRAPLRASDTANSHAWERAWLARQLQAPFEGPTVVVTHHAPHRGSLAPAFAKDLLSAAYVSELPESFFAVPVLWVHGHTHDSFDYRVGGCRVVCNPRGYGYRMGEAENRGFDPGLVVVV